MNRKIKMALAGLALIATSTYLYAAGMFSSYPIVGGAATCANFATNPTTGAVLTTCNGPTIPAGPTIVTGNELIPADTQLASGQTPQTVRLSMASLQALPYVYRLVAAGTAADTVTMSNTTGTLVYDVATGPITSATVTLPAAPIDGQTALISSSKTITTFAVVANTGQTLAVTTPTVLTASTTAPQGYKFLYRSTDKKWYKIQ